jgi:hypothetical protein
MLFLLHRAVKINTRLTTTSLLLKIKRRSFTPQRNSYENAYEKIKASAKIQIRHVYEKGTADIWRQTTCLHFILSDSRQKPVSKDDPPIQPARILLQNNIIKNPFRCQHTLDRRGFYTIFSNWDLSFPQGTLDISYPLPSLN